MIPTIHLILRDMKRNEKLCREFKGLTIYDSENEQFPYFVEEWDECFTYEEIKEHWREDMDFANIDTEQERTAEMPWDYGRHFE